MAGASIPKRKLGNTGLEVSVLGFGGGPLGGVYQDITNDMGIEAVKEAFKLGVNFFDTSPYYGITRSEKVLGQGLRGLPRNQVIVATKVGRYGSDTFDFSAERVTQSVKESLERLGLDYIDLIQTHDIEFGSLEQVVNETLPALQKLKDEGLVRHIGITGLPLKVFSEVLNRVAPGTVDTVLSYCHCSLNDRSLERLLPFLADKGVGVINASALSMGLLTKQGAPAWHPAPDAVKQACRAAVQLASDRGVDISKIALQDAFRVPGIASHLVGMGTVAEVHANVQTVLQGLGLAEDPDAAKGAEVLAEVKQALAPVQDMTWPSGRPENN